MAIVDKLEEILGRRVIAKLVENKAYKFTIDAIAMNVFSVSYALNEKFIAGMDWDEVGTTRLAAAIGNTITGRPYGLYRDWGMKKLNITKKSPQLRKYIADVGIFATGQTPIYMAYLAVSGADIREMLTAAAFLTFAAPLVGRPQGLTYDFVRRQFGLESALEKSSTQSPEPKQVAAK